MHGLKGLYQYVRQHTEKAEQNLTWAKRQNDGDPSPSWVFRFEQTAKRWRTWLKALDRLIEKAKSAD